MDHETSRRTFLHALTGSAVGLAVAGWPVPGEAQSRVLNVGPTRSYRTIASALAACRSGDTIIIDDGTYNEQVATRDIPSGPGAGTGDARFTVIAAQNPGKVVWTYDGWCLGAYPTPNMSWVKFDGILFKGARGSGDVEGTIYLQSGTHHAYFKRCGFFLSGNAGSMGTVNANGTYHLFEDCHFYGQGRYCLMFGAATYCIARRCVFRQDDVLSFPIHPTTAYGYGGQCHDIEWQNCIALDADDTYFNGGGEPSYLYYGYTTHGGIQPYEHALYWRGSMMLNCKVRHHINPAYAGSEHQLCGFAAGASGVYTLNLEDCIIYDVDGGAAIRGYGGTASGVTINRCTIGRSLDTTGALNGVTPMGHGVADLLTRTGSPSLRNTLVFDCAGTAFANCGTAVDYVAVHANGLDFGGGTTRPAHLVTYDPRTTGLSYLLRIEDQSPLKTAGQDGEQIGANVTKRIGIEGTFYGESGYNELTDVPLWPWPDESIIQANMASYSGAAGPSGRRGFCATGMTLTQYVWEYLGNSMPPELRQPRAPANVRIR